MDAYPKDTFHGTVTRFSGAVDPRSRTLLTEIQITNPKNRLRPGMYVRVKLTLEVHRGALTVPSEAVMGKEDRSVWVVADGKAKKTAGTVGVDTGKTARIVRRLLPEAHFATVYAKPMGRPMVDTFVTEVSQDTWIYFPWDTGLAFVPPIREGGD